jgi:hypothetical protein
VHRDLKIGGYVVGQFPNPPLWVALGALIVGVVADGGTVEDVAGAIFYVAITIWAWEEAAHGVNGFRKALGILALALIAISLARALA